MKKVHLGLALLVVIVMLVAACGAEPTETPQEEPVKPEATTEEAPPEPVEVEPVSILWWSHWAEEANKREFIEQVIADYEAENPNVDIEVVWWQKAELFNALQNASVAGEGFPDIFYFDPTAPQIVDAGYTADLSAGINWDNVEGWAKEAWTYANGEIYAVALEASTLELYINEGLFAELGIELPENRQLTADEFMAVAEKCKAAGVNVFAGGQEWWGSGALPFWYALEHKLGIEEFAKYFNGQVPVDSPEAREALEWAFELVSLPAYGDTYATNTIAEAHLDFHTKENACMFPVGSWYTGRAFVPPENGGQPAEFNLGCMPWPAIDGGVANDEHLLYAAGSLSAHAMSPNLETAIDIIDFMSQEKYGNLWMAKTGVQTGIKTNLETMPETAFDWYFKEFEECKPGVKLTPINVFGQPPDFRTVWRQVFNEGIPNGNMTLDEGLKLLEAARP